jgi:vancomycin permeability regulator SanA
MTKINYKTDETPVVVDEQPYKKRRIRHPKLLFLLFFTTILLVPFVIVSLISATQQARIYTQAQNVPEKPVAMIFGAGLNRDGSPSWMLADRVQAGVDLYKLGKVKQLLMTGDGVTSIEITAMTNYATRQGVPRSAIIADSEGLRTYDSCWRASNVLNIKSAVLVTQGYHLPRALYLCNSLGVESVGLKAGLDSYPNQSWFNFREFFATLGSWLDVNFIHPNPK